MKTRTRLAERKSAVRNEKRDSKGFGLLLPLLAVSILGSCLSPADSELTATGAPSTLPPPPTLPGSGNGSSPNTGNRVAYFTVESAWAGDKDRKEVIAECEILRGSAPASTTCMARMPEAQLYHSQLSFTWGTDDPSTCQVMNFLPYYYQVSNSAGFIPTYQGGTAPIDCSLSPVNIDCFNGVAKSMVSGFPGNVGFFFLTNTQASMTKTIEAAQEKNIHTNRFTVNDLVDQVSDIPGEYVGGSMQNYKVECRDAWNDLQYEIVFTLGDEDSDGTGSTPGAPPAGEVPGSGPTNHFSDWN